MSSIAFPPDDTIGSPSALSSTMDNGPLTMDAARAKRNRLNAAKSTGPRTPQGKSRSAQNARTHNLTAATPPPALLTDPTYRQAKQELVDELRPTTPMQQVLVSQLAHLTWQLDQIPKLEHQILSTPLDDADDPRRVGSAHHDLATDPDPATRSQDSGLSTQDYSNHLTAHHLLQNHPTPLTRLWDHHRRLLTRTQSLLRQLLQLQTHERDRAEDDAALESRLDRTQRAELLNDAERAARLRQTHLDDDRRAAAPPSEISNLRSEPPASTCQSAPNPANAHHPVPAAQNEPTPADPPPPSPKGANDTATQPASSPVGEGRGDGRAAQQGATPRNTAQQETSPAQNEPTPSPRHSHTPSPPLLSVSSVSSVAPLPS